MWLRRVETAEIESVGEASVVLVASGYESRASTFAAECARYTGRTKRKLCFGFAEHAQKPTRRKNDQTFATLGYTVVESSGSDERAIQEAVVGALADGCRHLAIDISSMTRVWYGAVVRLLRDHAPDVTSGSVVSRTRASEVVVDFVYTPAEWSSELMREDSAPNEIVGPVRGFASMALPDRPSALLLGLGSELDRALGVREYVDAPYVGLFWPRNYNDSRFDSLLGQRRLEIVRVAESGGVFEYPVSDPAVAFAILDSVCNGLAPNWRVVVSSVGPKIFSVLCFLVAVRRLDMSVWRISKGASEDALDRQAGAPMIVGRSVWTFERGPQEFGVPNSWGCPP